MFVHFGLGGADLLTIRPMSLLCSAVLRAAYYQTIPMIPPIAQLPLHHLPQTPFDATKKCSGHNWNSLPLPNLPQKPSNRVERIIGSRIGIRLSMRMYTKT